MYRSSLITQTELNQMLNKIVPLQQSPTEIRQSIDMQLRQKSMEKIKSWPNSLENANKSEIEKLKQEYIKKEEMRRKIDHEEFKFQQYNQNMRREYAKNYLFDSQELVRNFKNKMLLSDTLKEREIQVAQLKKIEERKKNLDKLWEERDKEKDRLAFQNELDKKEQIKNKHKEQFRYLTQQTQENKLKRIMDIQEAYVEGQINKLQALNEIKEDEEKRLKGIEKRRAYNKEILQINEENLKLKELEKQKILEEDQKIIEFEKKKNQMDELRKSKEKEKIEERQKQQNIVYQAQVGLLNKAKEDEEARLEREIKESENRKDEEEKRKTEKLAKLQIEIDEDRKLFHKRRAEEKIHEKQRDKELLDIWMKQLKEQEDREKQQYLIRKQKEKEVQLYRQKQIEDRKAKALTDFNSLQEESVKNLRLMDKEKDEFLKFAEENIAQYKSEGKDILPMLLELKYNRKKGLI